MLSALRAAVADPVQVKTRALDLHANAHDASHFLLVPRAVVVAGTNQGLALVAERRCLRRFVRGVRVPVHRQYPRLRQQRPRQAEQQEQGNRGTQGRHKRKDGWNNRKLREKGLLLNPIVPSLS